MSPLFRNIGTGSRYDLNFTFDAFENFQNAQRSDVFSHNLKTNIAIHLAVLLLIAMVLIDFVMIIVAQKALLQSEISKGYLFFKA